MMSSVRCVLDRAQDELHALAGWGETALIQSHPERASAATR